MSSLTPRIKLTNSSITKLQDACYSRGSLAKQLFEQEFTGIPECLFDPKTSQPYHSNKSQLVGLINTSELVCSSNRNQKPHGLVVDLSVIIRAVGASIDTHKATSRDFVGRVMENISLLGKKLNVQRIDIVADTYDPLSIKGPTRKRRCSDNAHHVLFCIDPALPQDFDQFLKNNENKADLNHLIADHSIQPKLSGRSLKIVVTYKHTLKCTSDGIKDVFN